MSKIQKLYVNVEFADGSEATDLRVFGADKIRWSDTAQRNGWDPTDEFRAQSFFAYVASKRADKFSGTYEEFVDGGAVDWVLTDEASGDVDPTQTTA